MSEAQLTDRVEYRPIPGFIGYRVGSDGSFWTQWARGYKRRVLGNAWKQMRRFPHPRSKYLRIGLWDGKKKHTLIAHAIVLTEFRGPCPPGLQARHLNGDKGDIRLENLVWGTAKENAADRNSHGTTQRGETHGMAKLTDAQVVEIRQRYKKNSRTDGTPAIARDLGVSQSNIHYIVSGQTRHGE